MKKPFLLFSFFKRLEAIQKSFFKYIYSLDLEGTPNITLRLHRGILQRIKSKSYCKKIKLAHSTPSLHLIIEHLKYSSRYLDSICISSSVSFHLPRHYLNFLGRSLKIIHTNYWPSVIDWAKRHRNTLESVNYQASKVIDNLESWLELMSRSPNFEHLRVVKPHLMASAKPFLQQFYQKASENKKVYLQELSSSQVQYVQPMSEKLRVSLISQDFIFDIDTAQAFAHLLSFDIKVRLSECLENFEQLRGLEQLLTIQDLSVEINMINTPYLFEKKFFKYLKFPPNIVSLKLMLVHPSLFEDCNTEYEVFQDFDRLTDTLHELETKTYLAEFVNGFEKLSHLRSFLMLSLHFMDRLPMSYLMFYSIMRKVPGIEKIGFAIHNRFNELNMTYVFKLLKRPEIIKEITVVVAVLGFRFLEKLPNFSSLKKLHLRSNWKLGNEEPHIEGIKKFFDAIGGSKVEELTCTLRNLASDNELMNRLKNPDLFKNLIKLDWLNSFEAFEPQDLEDVLMTLVKKKYLRSLELKFLECEISQKVGRNFLDIMGSNQYIKNCLITAKNGRALLRDYHAKQIALV